MAPDCAADVCCGLWLVGVVERGTLGGGQGVSGAEIIFMYSSYVTCHFFCCFFVFLKTFASLFVKKI